MDARYFRRFPLLNRKKTDPTQFVFTGDKSVGEIDIQLFKYKTDECIETKDIAPSDVERFDGNSYQYWLNIYGLSDSAAIASICQKQGIHDLVIQDILDVNQRPKFQEFDDFCFLTIKSVIPASPEMDMEQVSFVMGKGYLISFQERKADYFEHIRYRLRERKGIVRERGEDYLLYTMLESILDNYFKKLEQLDRDVEQLDLLNKKVDLSPAILETIERNKKSVHIIKKAILPIKEFTLAVEREGSPYIEKRHIKYFLEIKDLCLTLLDSCDTLAASLDSSANLFFSVQGHRMNQAMKTLTIVATIFIPLTFIAGIYGMNFEHMPELEWKYGYAAVWALILIIFTGMIVYFRKRRWL